MPQFTDARTGETITVTHPRRLMRTRMRRDRYTEITDVAVVPDGTVAEVLEWAGDDPAKRAQALTAERAGKNRKGILEAWA